MRARLSIAITLTAAFAAAAASSGLVQAERSSGVASKAAGSGSFAVSWADGQHGWEICGGGVCASNDGGRSWRRLALSSSFGEVSAVARTSATAGVIASTPTSAVTGIAVDWTRDAGRTWHGTRKLSGCFQGDASFLFADAGAGIVQVTPWPPTGRNLQTRPAWSSPSGRSSCYPLANLPGGVAALVDSSHGPLGLAVLVHRLGLNRVIELSQTNESGVDYLLNLSLSASWPDLYVTAQAYANTKAPPGNKRVGELFWHSTDGGKTWAAGLAQSP
jgi:hypothetical protein